MCGKRSLPRPGVSVTRCLTALLMLLAAAAPAYATDKGKALIYGGAGQGKVIFDGGTHASKGYSCNDCHLKLFTTRKKALITMGDHLGGKSCFACHNGKIAFDDCASCHRKLGETAGQSLTYEGASTIAAGIIPEAAKAFQEKTGVRFGSVGDAGADKGFRAALDRRVTFGGLARELTPDEKRLMPNNVIIGYDVLGIFINPANPVKSLSVAQLRDIFTGRTTNWKGVGGKDAPVTVYTEQLVGGRATVRAFRDMVLGKENYGKTVELDDATDCLKETAREKNGITVSSMSFAIPGVKVVALNGALPVKEKVQSGDYPLKRPLVLVTADTPEGPVKDFLDFLMSEKGQAIVAKKFVPVK